MLLENDIKAALVNKIIKTRKLDDDVIINEMVIGQGERRADLVLAKNYLHAFEIKSDADNLSRLDGQLASYSQRFEKSTLITSEQHPIANIHFNNNIEVWTAKRNRTGSISFKIIKRGKREKISNRKFLCDFLTKQELEKLVKANNPRLPVQTMSREELSIATYKISLSELRSEVLKRVKNRYKNVYESFLENFGSLATPENVKILSKAKQRKMELEEKYSWKERNCSKLKKEINFSRLLPTGDIPESIPRHLVLPDS